MHFEDNQEIKWYKLKNLKDSLASEFSQKFMDGANVDDGFARYEYDDNYDMFYFNVPEGLKDMAKSGLAHLGFYISKTNVICVYDYWDDDKPDIVKSLIASGISKKFSNRKIILSILDHITKDDGKLLGKLEDCIAALEDSVIHSKDSEVKENIHGISDMKQTLLPLKQMYEQLIDALEDLMEDENDIYTEVEIKYCTRIYSRIERLYKTVINLRENVSQTREAYQAQMDISLNVTMKTFTVITAIFLPLTFIAGWYGMNFKFMPELSSKFGYIGVTVLSVIIVIGCLIIFKKRKWF